MAHAALVGRGGEHIIMFETEAVLRIKQSAEIAVVLITAAKGINHTAHTPINLRADETAFLQLGRLFLIFNYILRLVHMALKHKRERKSTTPRHHLIKMLGAEAEAVGFYSDVGLHHGGAHNIIEDMVFDRRLHSANRAAVNRFKNLVNRNGTNIITQNNHLPFDIIT